MRHHPRALIPLTWCYSLFMAAFCEIVASLTLYQTNSLHIPTAHAYGVFAAAMALLWILPLLGGYFGAKLGYFAASVGGLIVCIIAMCCFCSNNALGLYLGLALFVVGNAFVTPCVWCMVDHCYAKDSPLREAGFTLFYLYFNFGAIIGIFLGGWLAETWGFAIEFAFGAIMLALALLALVYKRQDVKAHPARSIQAQLTWSTQKRSAALLLLMLAGLPITAFLFKHVHFNNILTLLLTFGMSLFLIYRSSKFKEIATRQRLLAFVFLTIISLIFWTLYSLEPSFLSIFIKNNAHHSLFGLHIPTTSFFAFDGVFVILFGFILSRLWFYLSVKNKNPSLSLKFGLSLALIGAGFVFLGAMVRVFLHTPMPAYFIVIAYAIFATGELLVSPIGIAMVGMLAPEGEEGLMMGFWQLACGAGGVLAGYIAIASKIPDKTLPLTQTNPLYSHVFLAVGLSAIASGVLVLLCLPRLNRLIVPHQAKANAVEPE